MKVLYFSGLHYGLGDIIKGLSSLKNYVDVTGQNIDFRFIMPKKRTYIHYFKDACSILVPDQRISIDLKLERSILVEGDHPIYKLPDAYPNHIRHCKKELEILFDYKFVDYDLDDLCRMIGVRRDQLYSFKMSPNTYWKCIKTGDKNSKFVSIQFNQRSAIKGFSNSLTEIIIKKIRALGYECIDVGHCTTMTEVVELMSKCKYHVGIDSGPSHVAHSMNMPCFIISNDYDTGENKKLKEVSKSRRSIGILYNHQFSLTKMYDVSSFLQINNFEEEEYHMEQLLLLFCEHNVYKLQLLEALAKQQKCLLDRRDDSDLIDHFISLRTRQFD